jgi:hypothetical protein
MGGIKGTTPVESPSVNTWKVSANRVQIQEEPEGYSAGYKNEE